MPESIRITPLSSHIGSDSSPSNPAARAKTATPSPASLPRGGSQLDSLKALGSRAAAGETATETSRAPLTRELSFREWLPSATAPATSEDDWPELDDIFRRQPAAGQASAGAPAHSLIDAPQVPLRNNVSTAGPHGLAARQGAARTGTSGASGMLSAIKRSAKNLLGLGRSSSQPTQKQASAPVPLRAASRPVTAPKDPVAETVAWIHEQNGRPAAWRNAIPKLSVAQARREGKAVPTRRAPPPPMAGTAGRAARPTASTMTPNNLAKPKIGSAMVSKPQTSATAPRRDRPDVATAPRRAASKPLREGLDFHLPKLGPLSAIPENQHETGHLASMGQHYDGLWRDLRGSIIGANSALQSLRTTPRKGLTAKRAELQSHAAELKRLVAETEMAEVDLATVQALKHEAPSAPNNPDSLRARAVAVDRDIHETVRQRNHARVALDRLQRAIASLPPTTGR
jgi:hypothetical protein